MSASINARSANIGCGFVHQGPRLRIFTTYPTPRLRHFEPYSPSLKRSLAFRRKHVVTGNAFAYRSIVMDSAVTEQHQDSDSTGNGGRSV